jgi:hypothetical protein
MATRAKMMVKRYVRGNQAEHGNQSKNDGKAVTAEMIGQLFFDNGFDTAHGYAS